MDKLVPCSKDQVQIDPKEGYLILWSHQPHPGQSLNPQTMIEFGGQEVESGWIFQRVLCLVVQKHSYKLYLSSSLCTYEPSRSLRSSKEKLFKIPKRNLKSFGERSFRFMAPSVWNSLPADLRNLPTLSQFKSNLKTFLLTQAFPQI